MTATLYYTKQPPQHLKPIKSWVHGKLPATEKYTAPSLALFLSDPTYRGLTAASYACLSLLFTRHVAAAKNIDINLQELKEPNDLDHSRQGPKTCKDKERLLTFR